MIHLAGQLYHLTGSKRRTRLDTMIAASAILAGTELATVNAADFAPFVPYTPASGISSSMKSTLPKTASSPTRSTLNAPKTPSPPAPWSAQIKSSATSSERAGSSGQGPLLFRVGRQSPPR